MKISLFFILTLLIASCSMYSNKDLPYSTVPMIKERSGVNQIDISNKEENSQDDESEEVDIEDKYTIMFGPGLYLTGGYLPIIRELEDDYDQFLAISGHGVGTFFASMFAFQFKSDFIEWKFYKFLEQVKNLKVFSKEWKRVYRDTLLSEFENQKIEDAKIKLIIPIFDTSTKKVIWLEKGNLIDALMANVNIQPHQSKQTAAFPWEFIAPFYFRNIASTKFAVFLPMHDLPKFKNPDGYLNGVYTKAVSNFIKTQDIFSKIYKLPLDKFKIDNPAKLISEDKALIEFSSYMMTDLVDDKVESNE